MDAINLASIIVAAISAAAAYAAQRSAAKASITNTSVASRMEMEKEAYERARAFDTETIARQNKEIAELRSENTRLDREVRTLKLRLVRLERGQAPPSLEELLRERLAEPVSDEADEHPDQ